MKFERGKCLLKCVIKHEETQPTAKLHDYVMGIDVGIKSLAVVSYGSHKMRRLVRQLKHRQRTVASKQKGSNNRVTRSTVNMKPKVSCN